MTLRLKAVTLAAQSAYTTTSGVKIALFFLCGCGHFSTVPVEQESKFGYAMLTILHHLCRPCSVTMADLNVINRIRVIASHAITGNLHSEETSVAKQKEAKV